MDSRAGNRQSGSDQPCLLVYDGDCRLCVGTKLRLEQAGLGPAGSGIRFLAYQSEEAKQVLGTRYIPGRPAAAFLVRPTGEVREGLDAFLPLLPSLPGGQALLWLLRFPLIEKAATWGYHMMARHRYRLFGKARPSQTQP